MQSKNDGPSGCICSSSWCAGLRISPHFLVGFGLGPSARCLAPRPQPYTARVGPQRVTTYWLASRMP